jgi:hypothetical protein
MVHGNVDQDRTGPAADAQVEGAFQYTGKVADAIHAVDSLAEGAADLELASVQEHVHLLVGMAAKII